LPAICCRQSRHVTVVAAILNALVIERILIYAHGAGPSSLAPLWHASKNLTG
jgi:hypothetical protein